MIFLSQAVSEVNKASMCDGSVQYVMSQSFAASSLVKSEPAWLHPEVLGFEADGCLWCILVDRAVQSLQMKVFACFQCFQASLHLFRFCSGDSFLGIEVKITVRVGNK